MKKTIYFSILSFLFTCFLTVSTIFAGEMDGYQYFERSPAEVLPFMDVKETDWFAEPVKIAYELGLVKGKSETEFQPKATLSIAEAIALKLRIQNIFYQTNHTFPESTPWYQSYLDIGRTFFYLEPSRLLNRAEKDAKMKEPDYNRPITREELAALFGDALPQEANPLLNDHITVKSIADIDNGMLFAKDIISLYQYGIFVGQDSYLSFSPKKSITRAEIAAMLTRLVLPDTRKEIGKEIMDAELHLERDYDWFFDQNNTGPYSHENCGPCVTAMMLKWYNPQSEDTPEGLRALIRPKGGWWYTNEITDILEKNSVPYKQVAYIDTAQIVKELEQGKLVMLCLDGYYMHDAYDNAGAGHFIILKGYIKQKGILRFESYNPDSGKDAYYFSQNIDKALKEWFAYLYIIG